MDTPRTTLTRAQYDSRIEALLRAVLAAEVISSVMRAQYEKSADEAENECEYRGVHVGALPDGEYTAAAVDDLVDQAEAAGHLTPEALAATAQGLTLPEFRRRHGGDPATAGDLTTYRSAGTPFSL